MFGKSVLICFILIGVVSNVKPASYKPCDAGKECVPSYLCENGSIEQRDILSVINVRMGEISCPPSETCCSVNSTIKTPYVMANAPSDPKLVGAISSIFDLNMGVPTTTTASSVPSGSKVDTTTRHKVQPARYKPCDAGKECVPSYLCENGSIEQRDILSVINVRMGEIPCPPSETCCSVNSTIKTPNAMANAPPDPKLAGAISSIFNLNMGVPTTNTIKTPNVMANAPSDPKLAGAISSIFNLNMGVPTTTTASSVPSGSKVDTTTRHKVQPARYKPCDAGKECVPSYLCENGSIEQRDILSVINVRMGEIPCPPSETCCSVNSTIKTPNAMANAPPDPKLAGAISSIFNLNMGVPTTNTIKTSNVMANAPSDPKLAGAISSIFDLNMGVPTTNTITTPNVMANAPSDPKLAGAISSIFNLNMGVPTTNMIKTPNVMANAPSDPKLAGAISSIFDLNMGVPTTNTITTPNVMANAPSDPKLAGAISSIFDLNMGVPTTNTITTPNVMANAPSDPKLAGAISSIFNLNMGVPTTNMIKTPNAMANAPPDPKLAGAISSIFNLNMGVPTTNTIKTPNVMENAPSDPKLAGAISSIFDLNMGVPTTNTITTPNVMANAPSDPKLAGAISSIFNLNMGVPTTNMITMPNVMANAPSDPKLAGTISSIFNLNMGIPATTTASSVPSGSKVDTTTRQKGQPGSFKPCGIGKICTPKYLCHNGEINDDSSTLIVIRMDVETPCPFLETCCSANDTIEKPSVRSENTPDVCGHRNPEGVGFRISGAHDNEAQFGEFPWMVAILRETIEGTTVILRHHRGGSLISPKVVLTAAHCIHNSSANTFTVRAGEWEYNSSNEPFPHQDRSVIQTILHENFNMRSLRNDIALMFLASPFELAPNVNTICLPPADFNFDFNRCYVTGWGKVKFHNGQYVNILKKIDVPIVPHSRCQTNLKNALKRKTFNLHSSFLCAGGKFGKDACTGDGGSPLVCPMRNHPNRFYQAGIVAGGIGCGNKNVPGLYVNVPELRRWIDSKLSKGISFSDNLNV